MHYQGYHSGRLGYRHLIAFLSFFGAMTKQATRVALSVAVVAMVKPSVVTNGSSVGNLYNITNSTFFHVCPYPKQEFQNASANTSNATHNSSNGGEFDWDSKTQGILHGAFYYGYLLSQVPGGWLSHRIGAARPIGVCTFLIGVFTLLSPVAAYGGVWIFFMARLIIGLATGVVYPSFMVFWSEWSPPLERGRLLSGAGSGSQLGTVLGMFVSGLLADAFGWESIFYCFGTLTCLWCIPWALCASDSPSDHPRISEMERNYIVTAIGKTKTTAKKRTGRPIPWLVFFKTIPFYAMLVVEFGHNWGFYTLLTNLPTYLNNVLHFSLRKNGFLSALPYLARWFTMITVVYLGDWIRTKNLLSATVTRKMFSLIAFLGTACALVGVSFAGCNSTLAVSLLIVSVGILGCTSAGFFINYPEMSPEYSGVLIAIGNTFGTTTGIIAPYVAGVLTQGPEGQTIENWRIVFLISAGMYTFIAIFYAIFGSSKQQSWDPTGRDQEQEVSLQLQKEKIALWSDESKNSGNGRTQNEAYC